MGRAGETWWRTFALASVMAGRDADSGAATGTAPAPDDNDRILRYLAKITINPALVHGIAHDVGRLAVGHLADIVLWRPALFAAKPQLVLKAGFPACLSDAEIAKLANPVRLPECEAERAKAAVPKT